MTAKEENLPLLKWIQDEAKFSNDDQNFEYVFNIGEKTEFQIRIKGHKFVNAEANINLADFDEINVQLFEFPRVEPGLLEASNMNISLPDGNFFQVSMSFALAPSPIFPDTDDRFSGMPWSQGWLIAKSTFGSFNTVCYLMASPDTVCDIINHCYKLTSLKAFW